MLTAGCMPAEVNTVTLVYTLYPVTHNNAPLQAKVTDDKGVVA